MENLGLIIRRQFSLGSSALNFAETFSAFIFVGNELGLICLKNKTSEGTGCLSQCRLGGFSCAILFPAQRAIRKFRAGQTPSFVATALASRSAADLRKARGIFPIRNE